MPMPVLPIPQYPNVPALPGVPPVLRSAATAVTVASHLYAVSTYFGVQTPKVWGIFGGDKNDQASYGKLVINPDSFLSLGPKQRSKTAEYIMQAGSFGSYNKVAKPYELSLRITHGGTEETRTQFLNVLKSLKASLSPLMVITPEEKFDQANLQDYAYQRKAENGATLLIVDCTFVEIRQTAQANYTQANTPMNATAVKSPSAAAQLSNGAVQASPITPSSAPYSSRPVQ